MLLRPAIKNYPWGRLGITSLVAQLDPESTLNPHTEQTPYAELWMGAHPSGPCIMPNGQSMDRYIQDHPEVLGSSVLKKYGPNLPFLFKVLSVGKALSIQAHPDKRLARILHAKDPTNYPDDNHKPEMAIAISPFEVLCGFRSLQEIKQLIEAVPELTELLGDTTLESKEDLQEVFTKLMRSDQAKIGAQIDKMVSRGSAVPEHDLISRLHEQYPGDIGICTVFFLQHFTLQPGEALFLPANEPHAYLSGDCMECMANSDNVVRAGLTPKFKDVSVLASMLTFDSGKEWTMKAEEVAPGRFLYKPAVEEFAVEVYKSEEPLILESPGSCSVCILLSGKGQYDGQPLKAGSVLFLPADTSGILVPEQNMVLYRSFVP